MVPRLFLFTQSISNKSISMFQYILCIDMWKRKWKLIQKQKENASHFEIFQFEIFVSSAILFMNFHSVALTLTAFKCLDDFISNKGYSIVFIVQSSNNKTFDTEMAKNFVTRHQIIIHSSKENVVFENYAMFYYII